jgi:hypothetical protein
MLAHAHNEVLATTALYIRLPSEQQEVMEEENEPTKKSTRKTPLPTTSLHCKLRYLEEHYEHPSTIVRDFASNL